MHISAVGVVGLGTMGAGIVEVMARHGLQVVAVELDDTLLAAGRSRLERSLGRAVDRGRLEAAEHDAIVGRVRFTTSRHDLADVDLVTEAVPERLDVKLALFADLDAICAPHTILATNTSSLPVTRIAAATGRPDRVIGLHFFNPAPVMRLVEVVHTVVSDAAVVDAAAELARRCGKTPVVVADRAGFVANALLFGYLNAAALAVETHQASATAIDAAMVAGCGFPMGPLTLLDLIGLDVSLDVLETMYDETRDQRFAAAPRLRRLVMAGQLGRKTGRGYHRYDESVAASPAEAGFDEGAAAAVEGRGSAMVVAVGRPSRTLSALGDLELVTPDGVGAADVIVVDGGSAPATAELAARVARRARPGAVIAVATSDDAPLASAAASTGRVSDVVGLHAPLTPLGGVVEVVVTTRSDPAAAAAVAVVVTAHGLTAVVVRDRPGLLVEALLLPHLCDAVRMVDDGYATRQDVDTAMRLGCGYPDGPFAMLDAVGADDVRAALLHLAAATHRSAYSPPPLLDELAALGPQLVGGAG